MAEEEKESTKELRRIVPPVDIYETSSDVTLVADVPGLTKDKLHIDIEEDELTIKGALEEPESAGKKLINECIYGEYYRAFTLGDIIDRGKIAAKLDNGVLILTLPKVEKVKPRKIAIETQ